MADAGDRVAHERIWRGGNVQRTDGSMVWAFFANVETESHNHSLWWINGRKSYLKFAKTCPLNERMQSDLDVLDLNNIQPDPFEHLLMFSDKFTISEVEEMAAAHSPG